MKLTVITGARGKIVGAFLGHAEARAVREDIQLTVWRALGTRAGGEEQVDQ
jgi:hypothetical protein